jgi:hypothetical protein
VFGDVNPRKLLIFEGVVRKVGKRAGSLAEEKGKQDHKPDDFLGRPDVHRFERCRTKVFAEPNLT